MTIDREVRFLATSDFPILRRDPTQSISSPRLNNPNISSKSDGLQQRAEQIKGQPVSRQERGHFGARKLAKTVGTS